jgi:hypothetical protein
MKKFLVATVLVAVASIPANAGPMVTVTTTDNIYGPFSGSIAQGATGAAATLSWHSAGFGWNGSIGLTQNGLVVADIQTSGDNYVLYAPGSANAAIGNPCTDTECLAITNNVPTSLYSTISAANGGSGICCGSSDVPATAAILGTAVLALGASRRRFR